MLFIKPKFSSFLIVGKLLQIHFLCKDSFFFFLSTLPCALHPIPNHMTNLGALAYAELGTMITKSGAEYAYLLEAGKALPRSLAPIPAFLCSWVSVLVLKPCLFAVISLGFGIYVVEPFYPGCEPPPGMIKLVSILCICESSILNLWHLLLMFFFNTMDQFIFKRDVIDCSV